MPAEIWRSQIDYFVRNYQVVGLDPRSQGDSDKPTDGTTQSGGRRICTNCRPTST